MPLEVLAPWILGYAGGLATPRGRGSCERSINVLLFRFILPVGLSNGKEMKSRLAACRKTFRLAVHRFVTIRFADSRTHR